MARRADAGDLRTKITIQVRKGSATSNGYERETWENVFPNGTVWHCKWVNAHGLEVFSARQAGLEEAATLTMRYTGALTPVCRILKGDDPTPYEVISVNDVEDRHAWLEVKVQRKAASR